MEQNLSPYDLEYMKMTMLKHEEIFKQQVYELHRLYRVQMLLMRASPQEKFYKNEHPRLSNEKKHMNNIMLDSEKPRILHNFDQNNEEAIDLTLGLGNCYNSKENDSKNVSATRRRLTSDSVTTSFSSSSTGSSRHLKKACVRRSRNDAQYQGQSIQQDRAMLEQPQWHLQVLSLNMTN